jgi:hypothetical protein
MISFPGLGQIGGMLHKSSNPDARNISTSQYLAVAAVLTEKFDEETRRDLCH